MQSENFIIGDTLLGARLNAIKNNIIDVFQPLVVSSSRTLSINEFIQALINGLIVDCTLTDITLLLPNGNEVIQALGGMQYTLSFLFIVAFSNIIPTPNKLTITTGTGLFFQQDQTTFDIDANSVGTLGVTIYSVSPPKVVLG
jgi:hypothetical protein